ncbi:Predicted PurR-regulated permease PerM [Modicisalibacter ilicicola DSM 19980]|uniref:Predicted PurR-regulated permease PerM n=1 Tax=Modicisalibacter ilicicola DSM 19980 TaxID=1121942 RepID=A0A1M4YLH7_9GAMM|nr:AI-2E family transporter [Halomonas ilicicola]SHF06611.1 Predicted PurR-regulated permease PerM [Halomonas ilicicola DSM 19980]
MENDENGENQKLLPERDIPLNLLVALAALVVIIAGMRLGADLLVPLILSLFIAVICSAPVQWLHHCGLGRHTAIVITLLVFGLFVMFLSVLLGGSIAAFMQALPDLREQLVGQYYLVIGWMPSLGGYLQPESISRWLDLSTLGSYMPLFLESIATLLSQSLLIMLLVGFMLFETLSFRAKFAVALEDPAPSLRRFNEFSYNLKRYLAVKTLISLVTGVLIFIACWAVGSGFPLLFATLAFLLNFIPNIGSALAAIPAVLLTLVTPEGGVIEAGILALAYLIVNFVIGNLIEPRIMGQTLGLSTLAAFMSLVIWGWILGPVGMLMAVPLTMTLKIALNSHPETAWLARVMGGRVGRRRKSE